jgi:hypothetical protein
MNVAILCHVCFDNGDFDTMWPGSGHDDDPTFGVADIETGDDGEWEVTWIATGLTVAEARVRLDQMELPENVHLMS